MLDNLTDLFNELKNRQTPLSGDLPVYGDHHRANPVGVWSWDCEREIVGTCLDDLEIVPRSDVSASSPRTYSVKGHVRGNCGHQHRTIAAAWRCSGQDQRDCEAMGSGAYSDRTRLVVSTGGEIVEATDDETEEWRTGHLDD